MTTKAKTTAKTPATGFYELHRSIHGVGAQGDVVELPTDEAKGMEDNELITRVNKSDLGDPAQYLPQGEDRDPAVVEGAPVVATANVGQTGD
jgi:hypothetical protein